jgi:hypothetical protein
MRPSRNGVRAKSKHSSGTTGNTCAIYSTTTALTSGTSRTIGCGQAESTKSYTGNLRIRKGKRAQRLHQTPPRRRGTSNRAGTVVPYERHILAECARRPARVLQYATAGTPYASAQNLTLSASYRGQGTVWLTVTPGIVDCGHQYMPLLLYRGHKKTAQHGMN